MAEEMISRRRSLKYLGLLAATATGQEFLRGWLPRASGATEGAGRFMRECRQMSSNFAPDDIYTSKFLNPKEFETLEVLTEMIIPTDEKPGAREARVAEFIDFVVYSAAEFEPGLQKQWTDGLALLERLSREKFGRAFREAGAAEREQLLTEMSLPERDAKASHPGFKFYRLVKGMTVEGFYSSRAGLLEALEYQGLTFLSEFPGCTHPEHQG